MIVTERSLKWIMRFYPPLLFQRIWVNYFYKDFRGVKVTVKKSFLNRNYNNSIFGGTIFSAADAFYPILFHQLLTRKHYDVVAWSKSSSILYAKPAKTDLSFSISISDQDIDEAERDLTDTGKYVKAYSINLYNKNGEICVAIINEIYVRNLKHTDIKSTNKPL